MLIALVVYTTSHVLQAMNTGYVGGRKGHFPLPLWPGYEAILVLKVRRKPVKNIHIRIHIVILVP